MAEKTKPEVIEPDPKRKLKITIAVGSGFVVLLIIILIVFWPNKPQPPPVVEHKEVSQIVQVKDPDQVLQGAVYNLSPFVLNLKNNTGILRMRVTLSFFEFDLPPNLQTLVPFYRDKIISVCTSFEANELLKPKGKKELKERLLAEINKDRSPDEEIMDIFFDEFNLR